MKLTKHNGRAGKNGVYNPKHNDRNFDVSNSEHITLITRTDRMPAMKRTDTPSATALRMIFN